MIPPAEKCAMELVLVSVFVFSSLRRCPATLQLYKLTCGAFDATYTAEWPRGGWDESSERYQVGGSRNSKSLSTRLRGLSRLMHENVW